jgi:transmembrane sensor
MNETKEKYITLITKSLAGEANSAERAELDEWLNSAEENRKNFNEFMAVWQIKPVDAQEISIDRAAAWQKINIEIYKAEKAAQPSRKPIMRRLFYAVSGVAAMLLIFLAVHLLLVNRLETVIRSYTAIESSTEPLKLSDGTMVYLREAATLEYPEQFKGKERSIRLHGDAFFEVAHQADNPFVVDLMASTVRVLGTSFYIQQQGEGNFTKVAVTSGKVLMQTKTVPTKEIILSAGERVIFMQAENKFIVEEISDYNFMAWKTGRLEFNQTGLPEVFSAMESTYHITIIAENDLSDFKLTARFSDEEPENIFKTIGMLFNLQIERDKNIFRVH